MLASKRCGGGVVERVREPAQPPHVEVDVLVRRRLRSEMPSACGHVIATVKRSEERADRQPLHAPARHHWA